MQAWCQLVAVPQVLVQGLGRHDHALEATSYELCYELNAY